MPLLLALIAVLLVGGGVYVYENKKTETPAVVDTVTQQSDQNQQQTNTQTPPVVTPVNTTSKNQTSNSVSTSPTTTDIEQVRKILVEMRTGYISGDKDLVLKYATKVTFEKMSGSGLSPKQDFVVNNIFSSEGTVVADVTVTTTSGQTAVNQIVFIKENGDWKFDIEASLKYTELKSQQKLGDPQGYADLVVTGVKLDPVHPTVNNKDISITVMIKNIGTKVTERRFSAFAFLVEGTKSTMFQATADSLGASPGETINWKFGPSSMFSNLNISDTPGKKTLRIELNGDHDLKESDYQNNTSLETIEIYQN